MTADWKFLAGFAAGVIVSILVVAISGWWRRTKATRKGRRGEKMVSKELSRLQGRDYIVINDLLLPGARGKTSQIDHLVVSTRGIFIIETKSHSGRIVGNEHSQFWSQYFPSQSHTFYNPLLQNRGHLRAIRRILPDVEAESFTSIVVFTEAWRLDIKAEDMIIERSLLPDRHIKRTLIPSERRERHWWCPWHRETVLDEHKIVMQLDGLLKELKRRKRVMSRTEVKELTEKLLSAQNSERTTRQDHTKYAKKTAGDAETQIRKGLCPRCGGKLIERKGEKGSYASCEKYPTCRFTCSIDRLHG